MPRVDSLSDAVYADVKRDILTGSLEPAARLQEAELAKRYSVSKTPVREALNRLVHEGLLDVFPRVGYIVSQCSVTDAQSVFEFRAILECAAVDLATRYITDSELEQLEALATLDVRPREPATYEEFFLQNRRFHLLIAAASRNPELASAIEGLFDRVDRLLHYRLDIGDDASLLDEMCHEHGALVNALRQKQPDAARSALMEGLDRTRSQVLAVLMAPDRDPAASSVAKRTSTRRSRQRQPEPSTA